MRMLGAILLLVGVPAALGAQASQASLETQLLHQTLFLRGLWKNDKLRFDAAGNLKDRSATTSPMLSAVEIRNVDLESNRLVLTGEREATVFVDRRPTMRDLKETVHLEIARPGTGDYGAAIETVLSPDFAGMAAAAPEFWQEFLLHGQDPDYEHQQPSSSSRQGTAARVRRVGGGVRPPVVTYAANAEYTDPMRKLKVSGESLVYLQVSTAGEPEHLHLVRPLGGGLDEQAIAAVLQYKFRPAEENGAPVEVEMNVEVNFRIF